MNIQAREFLRDTRADAFETVQGSMRLWRVWHGVVLEYAIAESERRMLQSITMTASISTAAPLGNAATPMAARAGYGCEKYSAMISLTVGK